MILFKRIIVVLVAYLVGSFSPSITFSKFVKGDDVRTHGSGNAGATNMARVYGLSAGFITLGGDVLKTVVSLLFGWWLLGDWGLSLGGIACIIGHCFPVYYKFKGGKGVSVGGVLGFAVDWRVGLAVIIVFLIFAFASKKVSLGSVCGAITVFVAGIIFGVSTPRLLLALVAMILVVFQHRGNISRLIKGTEPDFKPAHKK